jgi:hypothetical protein
VMALSVVARAFKKTGEAWQAATRIICAIMIYSMVEQGSPTM